MFPQNSSFVKVLKLDKIQDGFRFMFTINKEVKDYQIKIIPVRNKWKVIIQEFNGGLLGTIIGYLFSRFNKINLSSKKATIFNSFSDAMEVIKVFVKPLQSSVIKFHRA
jgi:hypothetical protein